MSTFETYMASVKAMAASEPSDLKLASLLAKCQVSAIKFERLQQLALQTYIKSQKGMEDFKGTVFEAAATQTLILAQKMYLGLHNAGSNPNTK